MQKEFQCLEDELLFYHVYQERGYPVIVHENIPGAGFIPATKDGLWQAGNIQVSVGGALAGRFDILSAVLRSGIKEKKGYSSADQILFRFLTPSKLVVGIVDGIRPIFLTEELIPNKPSAIFPEMERALYETHTGERFNGLEFPPDSFVAVAFTKLFPYSNEWRKLQQKKNVTAKDIFLAGNLYHRGLLQTYDLVGLPSYLLPGLVGSIAVIDFERRIISTAHIGDTRMGYERWENKYRLSMEDALCMPILPLSEDQNFPFDLLLHEQLAAQKITRGTYEHDLAVSGSYRKKENRSPGVGILNGYLNPLLIVESQVPLDEVWSLFLHTDGADCGDEWDFLNLAYYLRVHPTIRPLRNLRILAEVANLYPLKKDDDIGLIVLFFGNSPHCYTQDYQGKRWFLDMRARLDSGFKGWLFRPGDKKLSNNYGFFPFSPYIADEDSNLGVRLRGERFGQEIRRILPENDLDNLP